MAGSIWRNAKLDYVVDLRLSSVDKRSKPGERVVRLCNYVDVYKNRFIRSDMDFMLATATDREIAKCTLLTGDVIITKDSEKYDDIGVPALIRENIPNLVCGYHLAILRPIPEYIDGTYLFYAVSSFDSAAQFHSLANGVTRFGLRKADILRVEVPLPPLPVQRDIADVLGTLDDKIELNRRMHETLEQMAQALFKSWFVNFDPVRAKLEGRWRPGESLPGLPAELYDVFPNRLADSELGPVPSSWEVKRLKDLGTVVTGKTPSTRIAKYYGDDVPFLKIPDMHGKIYVLKTASMLSRTGALSQVGKALPPGSVSVSCIATPGLVVLIHRETQTNQQINSVVPYDPAISEFLYWSCKRLASEVMSDGRGSVFYNMNKSTFSKLQMLYPGRNVVNVFRDMVYPIHRKVLCNEEEISTLIQQRDALLPQLVSRHLPIGKAFAHVESGD